VVALGLLTLAGLLELALWTFDASDPLWGWGRRVSNRCGPLGALVAGGLVGAVGTAAHALPIAALSIAIRYLRGLPLRARWVPLAAWTALWISLAGALEVVHRSWPQRAAGGGALGGWVVDLLARALYLPGTGVLLAVALALSALVATGGSLRDALRGVQRRSRALGRHATQLARVSAARARMRWEQLQEARVRRLATARHDAPEQELEAEPEPTPLAAAPPRRPRAGREEPEVVEHRVSVPRVGRQQTLPFADAERGPFRLPDLELLAKGQEGDAAYDREALIRNSEILQKKLADFGVHGRVVKVHPGPVITMYEFEPAPGVKVSRIVSLSDDLALALRALAVRIVAPIPGKNVVGVEVPNASRDVVVLRDLLAHPSYQEAESRLTLALGKDIFGNPVVSDLAAMPHLLVAGATGTGKSVFLNALLCSILFRARPDEVKLLLIDPKMLEFSTYQGIPHLIADVVTNPKRAAAALLGVVGMMEERYRLMAAKGVRNIAQYNRAVARDLAQAPPQPGDELVPRPLPYVVVVIDELADLMIVAARDVEESLMRLAQMARASGIHLVLATQRPSVDVLTGVIKANFPSRISFQVSSRTDSRTVLDANGAERLLGMGDMLHVPPGSSRLERIHGPYVSEKEVLALAEFLRAQGSPEFDPRLLRLSDDEGEAVAEEGERDPLFDQAVDIVARHRVASISFIQRKLKIGYNRSARIVEQMEAEGILGPQEGAKPREIYVRPAQD
jgi:S-DNA-T family DNA segregation ATPase FtsK/SpoIIIE